VLHYLLILKFLFLFLQEIEIPLSDDMTSSDDTTIAAFKNIFNKMWSMLSSTSQQQLRPFLQTHAEEIPVLDLDPDQTYLVVQTGYTGRLMDSIDKLLATINLKIRDHDYETPEEASVKILYIEDDICGKGLEVITSGKDVEIIRSLLKEKSGVIVFKMSVSCLESFIIDALKSISYCYGIDDLPTEKYFLSRNIMYISYECESG